ncbi:excalibur calcium-binding domain-containing protein [Streptomyces sp. NBC_00503]|uniref:excalibur calcium-binding domain-containing protein n=1 Tax=Streptomyces sp. NBC_00503 TaxID=2903659 RepID=UPI002E80ADD6|nr:excalibur calcium-binding domain-containing protein [Streptomyces sp. NBC_00503]WUD84189.1 excalibur calcium-binding domain-containing protein [Streptomyces sp. NBC_00503]
MFHRRGVAIAGAVGAVALLVAGCQGSGASKGSDKPGAAAPTASSAPEAAMPALVGKTHTEAEILVKQVITKAAEVRSAYADVPLASYHPQWAVCFQTPAAGTPVTATTSVEISLAAPGIPCPEQAGATLHPTKAPSRPSTPTPGVPKPKSSPTPAPGPKDVTYKNCDEAKAAGAAPIRRGQPGYGKHLDRDNDGIACDK